MNCSIGSTFSEGPGSDFSEGPGSAFSEGPGPGSGPLYKVCLKRAQ